jgi:putative FmdB family regulatory protein
MPIYEYACRSCSHRFEELVSSSGITVACPDCTSDHVEKLFSRFSAKSVGGDMPAPRPSGGGGCGGGSCGCGH